MFLAGWKTDSIVFFSHCNLCKCMFFCFSCTYNCEIRIPVWSVQNFVRKTKLKFTEKVYLQPLQMIFLYLSLDTESKRC